MPQETIKQVLMRRDGLTETEADVQIRDASDEMHYRVGIGDLAGAQTICEDFFGLEPDYLEELI